MERTESGGRGRVRLRTALGALAGAAVLVLAGCGSSSGSAGPTGPATAVTLDEQANNTTVTVKAGVTVRVDLHSTYWSAVTSSAPQLLEQTGRPTVVPSPTGPACRVGSGCGTVSTDFLAHGAGSAQLTATRTTCGEALLCAPDQRTFTVTVQITGTG
ncbi:hypothetical protein GCM10009760_01740 [Kitasatospora kazusensis]|uniref:Uncharacterized protein n=1 Tax=Kitasatospora kazusensis TaxID=407974 RepID=A0ABP5KC38_9ACTN